MQFALEQRRQRFIDQTMTLQGFQSFEACGHDPQPEVPFASAAGMAGVRGTLVTHFQMRRLPALALALLAIALPASASAAGDPATQVTGVEKIDGSSVRVTVKAPGDIAPGDIRASRADSRAARAALDWSPRMSFADGLARYVDWLVNSRPRNTRPSD